MGKHCPAVLLVPAVLTLMFFSLLLIGEPTITGMAPNPPGPDCWDGEACDCGDRLIESKVLGLDPDDLENCPNVGLYIDPNEYGEDIVLDCLEDHFPPLPPKTISGLPFGDHETGIIIVDSSYTVTIQNCMIQLFGNGTVGPMTGHVILINNTIISNFGNGVVNYDTMEFIENEINGNFLSGVLNDGFAITLLENEIRDNGENGVFGVDASSVLSLNKIYDNTPFQVDGVGPVELSQSEQGNYWGRTTCPAFIAGTDGGDPTINDSYAYKNEALTQQCVPAPPPLECGDTLTASRNLTESDNLQNCPAKALYIDPDDGPLTLNCNYQNLSGAPGNADSGIYIAWGDPNTITIIGCNISQFKRGIWREHTGLLELFNNTVINNGEAIHNGGTLYATNNEIIDNEGGIHLVDNSDTIFKNKIYNNVLPNATINNIVSDTAAEVSHNEEGNYWGRTTCPAYIPGLDSRNINIVDSYAYKNEALTQQCMPAPECGDILSDEGETIVLEQDFVCSDDAFIIDADHVTFDCNGHSITGDGTGNGIDIAEHNWLTVIDCEISNFDNGIEGDNSNHGIVKDCNLHDNADSGIYWDPSTNITISNTSAYENGMQGFFLEDITDGTFINNYAYNNTRNGLHSISCINLLVENNVLEDNGYNGMHIDTSDYIFTNNTVNNNIRDGLHDTGGTGGRIHNNTFYNNTENGIRFIATTGLSNITENIITENEANGLVIDGNDYLIYLNKIYNNTGRELMVGPSNIVNLSYMQQGNYWGRSECPAYVPGVDSNDVVLNDTFAFTSLLMRSYIDQCIGSEPLECGDTITNTNILLEQDFNCVGTAFTIGADDVTFDCNGHSITGDDTGNGIEITNFDGLTVQNCNISHFDVGIRADTSDDGIVRFNDLHDNVFDALYWDPSDNITINNNKAFDNSRNGISLHDLTNFTVINNKAYNQVRDGIYGTNIADGYIANNTLYDNLYYGAHIDTGINIKIENNSFYDDGTDGYNVYGGFLCRWCGNVTIYDNKIHNSLGFGLQIEEPTTIINITDNEIFNSTRQGIRSLNSEDLMITKNYIYNNSMEGISLNDGAGNTIFDNDVIENELGIYINEEEGLTIDSNDVKLNNEEGILLSDSLGTISNNYVQQNCEGIILENGAEATIIDTDFDNNTCDDTGLEVDGSSSVELINGNFIYNGEFGINADGTVEWTLLEDVLCINNDIDITEGWIVPLGGDIIPDNCTVTVDGVTLNFSEGVSGFVSEPLDTTGGKGTLGDNETGVELDVHTGTDFVGDIQITFHDENPGGSGFELAGMNKWINVTPSGPINITWMILKIYYTDEEIAAANLIESTLRMRYYNETADTWETFNPPRGGVNMTGNYVWANVTHFSIFGVGGSKSSSSSSSSSSSGGGGGSGGVGTGTITLGELTGAGLQFAARLGQSVKFEYLGQTYTLKLKSVVQNQATVWFTNPSLLAYSFFKAILPANTPHFLDLNANGKPDALFEITGMVGAPTQATMYLKPHSESAPPVIKKTDKPAPAAVEEPQAMEQKTAVVVNQATPEAVEEAPTPVAKGNIFSRIPKSIWIIIGVALCVVIIGIIGFTSYSSRDFKSEPSSGPIKVTSTPSEPSQPSEPAPEPAAPAPETPEPQSEVPKAYGDNEPPNPPPTG